MINKEEINENYIFPQKNLQFIEIEDFLNYSKSQIIDTQKHSHNLSECYLSFYPLAKNVRFVSSYFYNSIKKGSKPVLSNYCRPGEDHYWSSKTGVSWYPWLWTRYKNKTSNYDSWCELFQPIEQIEDINSENISKSSTNFYLYLACLDHVFRLNDELKNELSKSFMNYEWPDKVCALQIRRGEIVPADGDISKGWNGRKLYSIDEYMKSAIEICDVIETKNIFISTDSIETIDYLVENYKDYNFLYNKFDRDFFIRYDGGELNMESQIQSDVNLIKNYTETCIVDLLSLSMCQGYVGGMKFSEYGLSGWFLQMAKQKKITPYFNIEGDFDLKSQQVGMLLL
jgi:hypothetical protein